MAGRRDLDTLVEQVRACRRCIEAPLGAPLPQEPRPILQVAATARLGIFSQAPGIRAHEGGRPFMDPSGVRLRDWLGLDEATFYDAKRVAIVPMGFCFPGHDDKGGDRPPRKECAPLWRDEVLGKLPDLRLALLIGRYAQAWHLGRDLKPTLTETVANWRSILVRDRTMHVLPLPHPSWRNNGWIKRHPWFETELLPELKRRVAEVVIA